MNPINERYSKVVCICLREREDKFKYANSQFEKHNIEVEWFRPVVPGYAAKLLEPYYAKYNSPNNNKVLFNPKFPNELGAMQSHYHVIKTALLEGHKSLFIFEDDCAFHKDFDTLLPKYFNTIPENADGIQLYSFMYQLEPQNIRVNARWTKGFGSWSIIAYGMNERAMKRYIELADFQPMIADSITWYMMTKENYNFYVASPPLIIPSKTLSSNIRGEQKNYETYRTVFMMGINDDNYE